ncbi:MAG: UDP-3-O-(3-hydroxymyristoyl)glucosamine N-acyltransferase [Bacteroidota bacterium]|nr:UDP-3-O-(3-hydroxymyristoyl)glucosamine N-acyltransferase [Bacteroidota bacterium]
MNFDRTYLLKEIADKIGCRFVGDPSFPVTGMNEIHMVGFGDLTFVDHPKYYEKALNSKATTILINKEVEPPAGKALIISEKPFDDYVYLAKYFRPFEKALAAISPNASIGEGTIIQPGTFIGNHVKIGKNCLIHANVSIYDRTEIGNNVIIHSGSVIGADAYYFQRRPEGYKKLESCGRVILCDNVEIGALCSIDKGVSGDTTIDFGTKLDNHVQIGHDTYVGKNCLIGAHCAIAGVTRIEDDVLLWARVSVNKDLVIGAKAVVLATSAIDKSIEGGKTYFGSPAVEARKKWRELAALRNLPDMMHKFSKEE